MISFLQICSYSVWDFLNVNSLRGSIYETRSSCSDLNSLQRNDVTRIPSSSPQIHLETQKIRNHFGIQTLRLKLPRR